MAATKKLISVDYEVFGRVQGNPEKPTYLLAQSVYTFSWVLMAKHFEVVSQYFSYMYIRNYANSPGFAILRTQRVFFRKFTSETAHKYGLKGWVKNTERGTVVGTVQGPDEKVKTMKEWLQYKGSPHSKIEKKEWLAKVGSKKSQITKCDFHNESQISSYSFTDFEIVRDDEKHSKKKKLKPRLSRP